MNAKGETLRPSSAWEALPLRSSLGLSAWKPWEDTQETGPHLLADKLSLARVLRCVQPEPLCVRERPHSPPGALAHLAWRHGQSR